MAWLPFMAQSRHHDGAEPCLLSLDSPTFLRLVAGDVPLRANARACAPVRFLPSPQ
jgi:hypothetical protein